MASILYVVATPLGNLKDITLRAIEVLSSVEVVACEDTRRTRKLLTAHGIGVRLLSCREHNEEKATRVVVELLDGGKDVAYATDAGTPGVSDPGARLVRKVREMGFEVVAIPGPSAVAAAVSVSGLPAESFLFLGFLPARGPERRRVLESVRSEARTIVAFEAPHRLVRSLADIHAILGDRLALLAREMTKLHEETRLARLSELMARIATQQGEVRGEITLVVAGQEGDEPPAPWEDRAASLSVAPADLRAAYRELRGEGLGRMQAMKRIARERGISKREVYRVVAVPDESGDEGEPGDEEE